MKSLILLLIGGCILTVGDIIQKEWVLTNKSIFFWIGIFCWTIGSIFLALTYKYKNMAVATMIFILINVITLILVSWFYYHEKLTTTQIIGMGFGLVAVYLLED